MFFPPSVKIIAYFAEIFYIFFFGERRFYGKPLDKRRGGH